VPDQDAPQSNDLYVEDGGRVWVTDRFTGGLYCLEPEPELAELIAARAQARSH
jgi:streptogramin lyase